MNPSRGSQAQTLFELCREFKCLPSELEKEDATTVESFIIILNELRINEQKERDRLEREAKLRAGMG